MPAPDRAEPLEPKAMLSGLGWALGAAAFLGVWAVFFRSGSDPVALTFAFALGMLAVVSLVSRRLGREPRRAEPDPEGPVRFRFEDRDGP